MPIPAAGLAAMAQRQAAHEAAGGGIGALVFDGSGKNYKLAYIQSFLNTFTQNNTRLLDAHGFQEYRTICNEFILYVPNRDKRANLRKMRDDTYDTLVTAIRDHKKTLKNKEGPTETEKLNCWIDACFESMGAVVDYFQEAWNFEKTRGIGVAGPFGGAEVRENKNGRTPRRFFPMNMVPDDGRYLRVPDNYKPKKGEEVFDFTLKSYLLMSKLDSERNYEDDTLQEAREELEDIKESLVDVEETPDDKEDAKSMDAYIDPTVEEEPEEEPTGEEEIDEPEEGERDDE